MADISPTTASTSGSTVGTNVVSSGTTAPAAPIEAVITALPDKIQQLERQVELTSTVTALPDKNTLVITTPIGTLTLTLPQLPNVEQQNLTQQLLALINSQRAIPIVIQPGDPPTQALIFLPSAIGQSGAPQPPLPQIVPVTTGNLPVTPPPVTTGTTLSAVVLPSITPQTAAPVPMPDLPLPSFTPAASLQTSIVPNPPPAPTATATTQGVSALLQAGNAISLQVDQVLPTPPTVPATTILSRAPDQIMATVIGTAPNGQIILSTGDATLYVRQNVTAPIGTSLLLTITPEKTADLTILPSRQWDSLSALPDLLATFGQINTQIAAQIMDNRIPQINNSLGGALLFFMSAMKQGNIKGWLGSDGVDALTHAGKGALLAKLAQQLSETGQDARDDVVGSWKSYPLPLHDNNQLQLLNLYVHGTQDRESQPSSTGSIAPNYLRFLIDMQMSRLGAIQLDGFVKTRQLDIILRSEHALPEGLHSELRQAYVQTMTSIDYTGSLNFQVGRQHWLVIRKTSDQATLVT